MFLCHRKAKTILNTSLNKTLIQKFNVQGPRYTSYPTAPEWQDDFPISRYREALRLVKAKSLSLYFHLPFCEKMCFYCGCNVIIRKQNPSIGDRYIDCLIKEMDLVLSDLSSQLELRQLHFGGGTPNFLSPAQLERLFEAIQSRFVFSEDAEIAIEVDPRVSTIDHLDMLKKLGFNRLSMGLQDFDPQVQKAVNRIQPFEMTRDLVVAIRDRGFQSINIDLIYGLPFQSVASFLKTVEQIIQINPDRIALYSYAHVPWLKSHQALIKKETLPSPDEKLDIFLTARERLLTSGYLAIAMDHFALKNDSMSKAYEQKTLYRNFMGYTLKPAEEFIGFGLSAIGYLSQCFVQNTKDLRSYYQSLDDNTLPLSRGLSLSEDDVRRQWVIQALMCHFGFKKEQFFQKFSQDFDTYFSSEQDHIQSCMKEGLLENNAEEIGLTSLGQLFVRNVCMGFDAYLKKGKQLFSSTV